MVVVHYSPDARRQLEALGSFTGSLVDARLRDALRGGWQWESKIRRLPVRHDPPWFAIRLGGGTIAIARRMDEAEVQWMLTPTTDVLVAFIVDEPEIKDVIERLKTYKVQFVDSQEEE